MIIEILYPQLCGLYGYKGNTQFLRQCLPEAEFRITGLNDRPAFLDEEVSLVCIHSMSEQSQEWILERLMAYRDEIAARCEDGSALFFLTGNALELFGRSIQKENGEEIPALGVYDFTVVRHAPNRFNTLLRGEFEGMTLLGYTSRFSDIHGADPDKALCRVDIGKGNDGKGDAEGLYHGRVLATYMLGPVLVANPDFAKWLLKKLGVAEPQLPYEEALYQSYETRRKEYERDDLVLD